MMPDLKRNIDLLIEKIRISNKICLVSHIHPDGDSIGSLLSFGLGISKIKKGDIKFALSDTIPMEYIFLPGIEHFEEIDSKLWFDLLIVLDCGDIDRIGKLKELANNSQCIVNIDHHVSNDRFGHINIVDVNASSTGEVVYDILNSMNVEIDKEIATSLYVAISTDTGSFKYSNTTAKTHMITAKLLEKGIDINQITIEIYQSRSLEKTKLFIDSLNTLELYCDGKIAVITVSMEVLKKNNASLQDADGIIEFIRDIESVEVACILKQIHNDEVKVGLRSKRYVDVAKIAKKFKGGGHIKASGCTIYETIDKAKDLIVQEIKKNLR